ncbi:hypothetical protein GCWU000182_01815 [Abiotrophia defectiva ATCC 49176]|uniref:Uncharacterized protein n=1 Tax=Abiotrophia defectiva ATCC 49176 TaxID=592010 RepID=W1Q1L0_ABIDE|nr:hypothetical protein GCWU000182_01815 [Abiotrophia defectiva ATCC 49176]
MFSDHYIVLGIIWLFLFTHIQGLFGLKISQDTPLNERGYTEHNLLFCIRHEIVLKGCLRQEKA